MMTRDELLSTETTSYPFFGLGPKTSRQTNVYCPQPAAGDKTSWHSSWDTGWDFKPLGSVVFPSGSSASDRPGRWSNQHALIVRIDQLEDASAAAFAYVGDRLDRLSRQVSSLLGSGAAAFDSALAPVSTDVLEAIRSPDPTDTLGEDLAGDRWVEAFDEIADNRMIWRSDLAPLARKGLVSKDPAVRSAAGRALMVLEGVAALPALEQALAEEESEYVRESYRAAIEALDA